MYVKGYKQWVEIRALCFSYVRAYLIKQNHNYPEIIIGAQGIKADSMGVLGLCVAKHDLKFSSDTTSVGFCCLKKIFQHNSFSQMTTGILIEEYQVYVSLCLHICSDIVMK